jgi:isopenicillin N synthase-like dioxygenase
LATRRAIAANDPIARLDRIRELFKLDLSLHVVRMEGAFLASDCGRWLASNCRTKLPERERMTENAKYIGFWNRLIISIPGKPIDTLTDVVWMQGPRFYVDIRRPRGVLRGVSAVSLSSITIEQARLLGLQEGFAGRFVVDGDEAEWKRAIDFRPPRLSRDRGRLIDEGDLLIERGVEANYIEYWQRSPEASDPTAAAARLTRIDDGRDAVLVQCGRRFAYARDRALALSPGADLATLLADAASTEEARALIDCEISFGAVKDDGWRIEQSTLPYRVGALLAGRDARIASGQLTLRDVDSDGADCSRIFAVDEMEGDFSFDKPTAAPPREGRHIRGPRSGAFTRVPVVDIAALGSGDAAAEADAVAAIGAAARNVGFLHVSGHGVAPAVIARIQAAAKRFFDQEMAAKMASYIGKSRNHRGYVPEGEEVFAGGGKDKKEAFDLSLDLPLAAVPAGHPLLGPNQWPELFGFREDVMAYYAAAFGVGRRLLRGFAMALGKPAEFFDAHLAMPTSQLRLVHYPFDATAADAQGIGAHTDYECFTLLLATAPGLEVMNRAGEWIDAPPVKDALVVNIGDLLEFWSGGAFIATSHRVRKVAEERYSFPLFFTVDHDAQIRSIAAGEDSEPLIAGEHLYRQTLKTFAYLRQRVARAKSSHQPRPGVILF